MAKIKRPLLEGTVAVRDERRLSFAEHGAVRGPAVIWMHGTPGARRQIPFEAREYAAERGIRLIGIDRPGIGTSTPHLYRNVADWTRDLEMLMDALDVDKAHFVGLSGGAPYVLAAGAALPRRVEGIGVMGGVAPTRGVDAIAGGPMQLAVTLAPVLNAGRVPIGMGLTQAVRMVRPVGGLFLDTYARFQPAGDRVLLGRPEFRAMFLDDLIHGSRFQTSAPLNDLVLFTRHWGFELSDVNVPVIWWHGDSDHIVPFAHGRHVASRLPHVRLIVVPGDSHLGGLGISTEVLDKVTAIGSGRASRSFAG